MTAALVIVIVIAVVALVALVVVALRSHARVAAQAERADALAADLRGATDARSEVEGRTREADRRAEEASRAADEAIRAAEKAKRVADECDERATRAETRAGEAEERAQEAESGLAALTRRADEAERRAEDADRRAGAAESREREIEARVAEAESRAREVEARVGAVASPGPAARGAPEAPELSAGALSSGDLTPGALSSGDLSPRALSPGALWDLERLRLEREWHEVAGPSAPLPVPWDGSLRAALAVELEIIREVVGTPGRLEGSGPAVAGVRAADVAAARIGGELLRCLARSSDDMVVSLAPDHVVSVSVSTDAPVPEAEVHRLRSIAAAAGGELAVARTGNRLDAQLRLPG